MRKPLNGRLFLCRVDFDKGPFDSFSEFIRKEFAKNDNQVDDFGMHMRIVQ